MEASLWVSKTGLDDETRMTTISNNLANVSTTGFKRDRAVFEDLLYQNIRQIPPAEIIIPNWFDVRYRRSDRFYREGPHSRLDDADRQRA